MVLPAEILAPIVVTSNQAVKKKLYEMLVNRTLKDGLDGDEIIRK